MLQIYRGKLQVHLQAESTAHESNFVGNWGDLGGGRGDLGVSASVLRATTKKGGHFFSGKKRLPQTNPGYRYSYFVRERLQNRYAALLTAPVCTCVTGFQHVECTDSVIIVKKT